MFISSPGTSENRKHLRSGKVFCGDQNPFVEKEMLTLHLPTGPGCGWGRGGGGVGKDESYIAFHAQ